VEIDQYGNKTPNRHWDDKKLLMTEKVAKWRKNWLPYRPSQLLKIQLISEEFEIPNLLKHEKSGLFYFTITIQVRNLTQSFTSKKPKIYLMKMLILVIGGLIRSSLLCQIIGLERSSSSSL